MKLSSLFSENHVLIHCGADTFADLVRRLLEAMESELDGMSVEELTLRLAEREARDATLVGDDICLPHLRLRGIKRFMVGLSIPEHPVEHPGLDGRRIDMVYLVLAPLEQNALMLQTMAAITRRLTKKSFVDSARSIRLPARIIRLIEESGVDVKTNVYAGDIMEPLEDGLKLDTPLPEAVDRLAKARDEGVPVFDDRNRLVGELTTREVLVLGMPKYMDLVSNPDMLNAFEPFENYFREEENLRVRDICRRDFITVPPSTPIITVAHRMITENRRRIYVVDEDRVLGIIYRKSILTRVMNH